MKVVGAGLNLSGGGCAHGGVRGCREAELLKLVRELTRGRESQALAQGELHRNLPTPEKWVPQPGGGRSEAPGVSTL